VIGERKNMPDTLIDSAAAQPGGQKKSRNNKVIAGQ